MKKWHDVYRRIAELLYNFAKANTNPGEALFNILIENDYFVTRNPWIKKFDTSEKIRSIDPIHIFSSISGKSIAKKGRLERITYLIAALEGTGIILQYKDINFTGCPTPININQLSTRNIQEQKEIWEVFVSIYSKRQLGLTQKNFSKAVKWFGIDISAFTQFLFWIDSKNFLPLDKNTLSFLLALKKIENRPSNYKQYKRLLENKDTNIYLEISSLSFNFIVNGVSEFTMSEELNEYINRKENYFLVSNIKNTTTQKEVIHKLIPEIVNDEKISVSKRQSFKVIGVKPLLGINESYRKALEEDRLYLMYNNYIFNNEASVIEYNPDEINIYKIDNFPQISISAIVGKNGTGKSTITELLYQAIYNISLKKKLLTKNLKHIKDLHVDIFFVTDFFYKIRIEDESISIFKYETGQNSFFNPVMINFNDFHLDNFFYTIAVNYSHYGLNSKKFPQDWITPLSHKNDGYQTPIVINPMRTEGNFNINKEDELLVSRLTANLCQPIDDNADKSFRNISENKEFKYFELIPVEKKVEYLYDMTKLSKISLGHQKEILNLIYNHFTISNDYIPFRELADKYIIKKLANICIKYSHYKRYYDKSIFKFSRDTFIEFLENIEKDNSHIAYKIKQAIYYLKYRHYIKLIPDEVTLIEIEIDELSKIIESTKAANSDDNLQTIQLIPPSFFNSIIKFSDKSNFNNLSSGETQLISIVSSIIYHLNNIDSVMIGQNQYRYGYINIILDEVELYFHPNFQRKFINYLLKYIGQVNLDKIDGINICFITHSPFILSDIIEDNILFLGGSRASDSTITFGANIYDLLADSFFLNDGFIGEFAENRIQEVIDFLCKKPISSPWFSSDSEIRLFIDKIGESFLREKLIEMYIERFPQSYDRDIKLNKIKALEEQISTLKNSIENDTTKQ